MSATKHDQGKRRHHLLPIESEAWAIEAFEYGEEKYSAYNWSEPPGLAWTRLYDSVERHLRAWLAREDVDYESGLHPLKHALAGLHMLAASVAKGLGEDDRPPPYDNTWLDRGTTVDMTPHFSTKSAESFLQEQLSRGKYIATTIRMRANEAGIPVESLADAFVSLNVIETVNEHGAKYWELP